MPTKNEIASYIWNRAPAYGVNPGTALGIAKFEGLNDKTLSSPTFGNPDAKGYSYGPFQLYSGSSTPGDVASGGLASTFAKQFGEAPSASNWQKQVDFSLKYMADNGTGAWYSVRDQGGLSAITAKGNDYASKLGFGEPNPSMNFNNGSVGPFDFSNAKTGSMGDATAGVTTENGTFTPSEVSSQDTSGFGWSDLAKKLGMQTSRDVPKAIDQQTAVEAKTLQKTTDEINKTNTANVDKTLKTAVTQYDRAVNSLSDYFTRAVFIVVGMIAFAAALRMFTAAGGAQAAVATVTAPARRVARKAL